MDATKAPYLVQGLNVHALPPAVNNEDCLEHKFDAYNMNGSAHLKNYESETSSERRYLANIR